MIKIIVAGCSTDVGKTIVSAILVKALDGAYWKPVQCGGLAESDSKKVMEWVPSRKDHIYPSAYNLKAGLSPHHAARLEKCQIEAGKIRPPVTACPLIIESVGGILVPLNPDELTLDLFCSWNAIWIVVSKHYLGSINHTLLTVQALKQRKINVHSIIFNGASNPDTEEAILHFSKLPCLGRLLPEQDMNETTINRYASQWKPQILSLLQ
jgi:dethiobiotin synthetase